MTFARLAKLVAVLLVAAALWRARPPEAPSRVVVLALPGASIDMVVTTGPAQPAGAVRVPEGDSGAAFWRSLFSDEAGDGARAPELGAPWSDARPDSRVVALPARLFQAPTAAADPETAFVGGSSGVSVEAADITSGRLPGPYDRAVDAVSAAAATLGREQWSDWIEVPAAPGTVAVPGAPVAVFQFARFSDTAYFFSPAYLEPSTEAADKPFLRGLDRELRPLVAEHVLALSRRRMEPVRELFPETGVGRAVLVFDSVAEDAASVFAPDSTPSALLDRVQEELTGLVKRLQEQVGPGGLVVVVGGPSTSRRPAASAWYRLLSGGPGAGPVGEDLQPTLDVEGARALVRYLGGAVLTPAET
ncbi:MAG: hypothetical protein ABR538_07375, partial [Candidatus Binatia bacterium]